MALHDTDTFTSLHILGEHLLAAGRYNAVGRIGLTVVEGGFATPPFGDDRRVLAVVDRELRVSTPDGVRSAPLTTLRAAAEFAGVPLGAPSHVYEPVTQCLPDAQLVLDPNDWARIVSWYEVVAAALRDFGAGIGGDDPSDVVLWPEHFDVAIRAADINYGGLAGDAVVTRPYAYVGPPSDALPHLSGSFWNAAFGAASGAAVRSVSELVSFFRAGHHAASVQAAGAHISPG
jgi:hypothetical protein